MEFHAEAKTNVLLIACWLSPLDRLGAGVAGGQLGAAGGVAVERRLLLLLML